MYLHVYFRKIKVDPVPFGEITGMESLDLIFHSGMFYNGVSFTLQAFSQ